MNYSCTDYRRVETSVPAQSVWVLQKSGLAGYQLKLELEI